MQTVFHRSLTCLEILVDIGVEEDRHSRNSELNQVEQVPFLQTPLVTLNLTADPKGGGFGVLSFSELT